MLQYIVPSIKVNLITLPPMTRKAIVLLSSGLDSVTTLAIAKSAGSGLFVIRFNCGQRHKLELERAKPIAGHCGS